MVHFLLFNHFFYLFIFYFCIERLLRPEPTNETAHLYLQTNDVRLVFDDLFQDSVAARRPLQRFWRTRDEIVVVLT